MIDRRWHKIFMEQCEAAEHIKLRYGTGSAFDYVVGEKLLDFADAAEGNPELAQELPHFVSRVRSMFTPQEMREHLSRIEGLRRKNELSLMLDGDPDFEDPSVLARRVRQFELLKELLTAPVLGTS